MPNKPNWVEDKLDKFFMVVRDIFSNINKLAAQIFVKSMPVEMPVTITTIIVCYRCISTIVNTPWHTSD
jgi:hypothetical protein